MNGIYYHAKIDRFREPHGFANWLPTSAKTGEKFGKSDLRTAVTLLANHGLARLLKFGDRKISNSSSGYRCRGEEAAEETEIVKNA